MSRLAAVAQGLYYPTPLRMVAAIAAKLKLDYSGQLNSNFEPIAQTATEPTTELIRVLDPCAGRGSAALFLTRLLCQQSHEYYRIMPPERLSGPLPWFQSANNLSSSLSQPETELPVAGRVELYGMELEAHRARLAAQNFTYFLHTNALSAIVAEQSFDLAFVNPPYDDSGDSDRRLEYTFLKRVTHTLKPGGVLVYIIPQTRLGIVAEYLAHYYTQVDLYRFADPEFGAFRQVVVLAIKKGQGQGRSKNRNQGHRPPLKATEPDPHQAEDGLLKLELTASTPVWTAARLREAAEIGYTQWLPILQGAPTSEKELARQLDELGLPRYDEVEAELRHLRLALGRQTEEASQFRAGQATNQVEPSYTVPCSQWNETSPELAFYAGEYHTEIALAEAQTKGVWSTQSVSGRALRQLVGATLAPVAMQSGQSKSRVENNPNKTRAKTNGNSNSTTTVRPLTPLRQGQAALLIAIGLLNNLVLEDEQGRKVLVKGRTFKEYRTTKVETDEAGNQTTTAREVVHSQVVTLDLIDGTLKELEQKELTPFLARFQKSIRRQMLRTYPPRYVPGQQDPLTQKLESGLRQLRRKPLGGQALAIVAAALALKQQGYATLSAEQGAGKSFMGAAAAYLGGASRIVVVCPPHLVNKWVREVEQTIRGGVAEVVRNSTELGLALKRIAQFEKHYTALTNTAPILSLTPTNKAKVTTRPARPPYFIILSRETTKLATRWQPGVVYRPAGLALVDGVMLTAPQTLSAPVRAEANSNQTEPENEEEETALSATDWVACCPRCGSPVLDNEAQPIPPKALAAKKRRCEALIRKWQRATRSWQNQLCGEPLWQQTATPIGTNPPFGFGLSQLQAQFKDKRPSIISSGLKFSPKPGLPPRQGPRRMALAKYIQRQLPAGYFDLLILDEMHEYKGQATAQGINAGRLVQACRGRVLALTGTLSGGKASDLFFLLWRTARL